LIRVTQSVGSRSSGLDLAVELQPALYLVNGVWAKRAQWDDVSTICLSVGGAIGNAVVGVLAQQWHAWSMSTWESASLSGVPERTVAREEAPREAVRTHVLDVAEKLINQHGLTVGLGHLGFDEIIVEAGVSRTTAYRTWPRKERFLEDLLRRLSDVASPCYGVRDDETAELAFAVLREHVDQLHTAEGRRMLLVEILRFTAEHGFADIYFSPGWRTFLALIATLRSLGNEELASELRGRMQAIEATAAEKAAVSYSQAMALLGYRPRSLSVEQLTHLGAAATEGAMLLADVRPALAEPLGKADPFSTGMLADWSLVSITYVSAMLGVLEPDPDYDLEQALSSFG